MPPVTIPMMTPTGSLAANTVPEQSICARANGTTVPYGLGTDQPGPSGSHREPFRADWQLKVAACGVKAPGVEVARVQYPTGEPTGFAD